MELRGPPGCARVSHFTAGEADGEGHRKSFFFVILSRSSDKLNLSHRTSEKKKKKSQSHGAEGDGRRAKKMSSSLLASGSLQLY